MTRRSRPPRLLLAAPAAVVLLGPLLAGCGDDPAADVRDAAQAFLTSWAGGKTDVAAADTTDATATAALLTQTATDLPGAKLTPQLGAVSVQDDTATVAWTATWDLAAAPDWSYDAQLGLRKSGDAWQVVAGPTVVHPQLGDGQHLDLERALPDRATISDADGDPLFTDTEVVDVGLQPSKVTDLAGEAKTLAKALDISAADIVADAKKATPDAFVPVVTLRKADYAKVKDVIYDLPGVLFPTATEQLAPSSGFAAALLGRVGDATADVLAASVDGNGEQQYAAGDQLGLSGLQLAYQQQLAGTAGYTITAVSTDQSTGDAGEQLASVAPVPGSPVQTPLVPKIQRAADAAVADQSLATHLVVVRPGTGELLGVSSNAAATPANALSGQFPPGSSMKTMTATALLSAGKVTTTSKVACPGTTTVDGREFENENKFDLGTVTLTKAFAESCNTTFIQQGLQLDDDALAQAAASYGVGSDWKLPVGIFSGTVPDDATGTTKAADQIGQGQVVMSPAQMALVAAGIASGKPAAPVEVVGAEAAGSAPTGPSADVLTGLRSMMRQVVLDGTATGVSGDGKVYGKTGTAEFGDKTPPDSHGWFVGYQLDGDQGDLAFAVLVEDGQSSSVAVTVADAFLKGLD